MKENFTALIGRLIPELSGGGYKLEGQQLKPDSLSAVFATEDAKAKIDYDFEKKSFNLYRAAAGGEYKKAGSYLFDPDGGDGKREIESAANDFLDTLRSKPSPVRSLAERGKVKKEDENSAEFFTNRIPSVLTNCKEPLIKHKAHYETILPNQFCEEVAVPAMRELLDDGRDAKRIERFFELLTNMYINGDLDTRAIIIQTILAGIDNPIQIELAEQKIGAELRKAWQSGRRLYGKEIKPEKVKNVSKFAQYQAKLGDN